MKTKRKDLTGLRINNLTVIKPAENNYRNNTTWLCKCDCGNFKEIPTYMLTSKRVKSCGCLLKKVEHLKPYQFKKGQQPFILTKECE